MAVARDTFGLSETTSSSDVRYTRVQSGVGMHTTMSSLSTTSPPFDGTPLACPRGRVADSTALSITVDATGDGPGTLQCGHTGKASIRLYAEQGWISLCLNCWQQHRSYYQSQDTYGRERRDTLMAREAVLGQDVARYADSLVRLTSLARMRNDFSSPTRPCRVLMYSHDTFGLGHLRRNLAIARQLLARPERFAVTLLTGSPVQDEWPVPEGLRLVGLPPVVKVGDEQYGPRDHAKNFALLKGHREARILETALRFKPDIFLVDHSPLGMGGELLPALGMLQEEHPETQLVLGLRDILDAPDTVCALWEKQGVYDIIERVYHHILVYGRQDWFDVVREYAMPASLAHRIRFCGYVCNADREQATGAAPAPVTSRKAQDTHAHAPGASGVIADMKAADSLPVSVVTVGGGGDGCQVIHAYLDAVSTLATPPCQSLIITGPLMAPAEREALMRRVQTMTRVRLLSHTTDLPALLRQADLVVAMAGYNTSVELLALNKPTILVPRARPREEQRLRAAMLMRLGLVQAVDPDGDISAQLAALIPALLKNADVADQARPPGKRWATEHIATCLNGAVVVATLFGELASQVDGVLPV